MFTHELECLMHEGKVDIAVHSLKDLPTSLPPNLVVGAIGSREGELIHVRKGVSQ